MGIIYEAKNTVNNMLYIGKTTKTLRIRANEHCNNAKANRTNSYFAKAIRKYGCSAFEFRMLEEADDSELSELEIYYIDLALDRGYVLYNLTDGGEGALGRTHTQEFKDSIARRNVGNTYHTGHTHDEETRAKMRESGKNKGAKTVILKSPEGVLVEIYNLYAFCKEHGFANSNMSEVVSGKRKSAYGWTLPSKDKL